MAEEAFEKYLREINPSDGWRTSKACLRGDATEGRHRWGERGLVGAIALDEHGVSLKEGLAWLMD